MCPRIVMANEWVKENPSIRHKFVPINRICRQLGEDMEKAGQKNVPNNGSYR